MNPADKDRVRPAADGPAPPEEEEEEGGEACGREPAADATPGPSDAFRLLAARREPAVKLQHPVSGLEPLAWSEDHRVSVSTARSIAVLELICDVHNPGQDLVIHRTSVPAPLSSCLLKVSPPGPPAAAARSPGTPRPPAPSPGIPFCIQRPGRSGWVALGGPPKPQRFVPSVQGHAPLPTLSAPGRPGAGPPARRLRCGVLSGRSGLRLHPR